MKRDYYKSLILGFYGVRCENGFCDGFLNKCRSDRIPIWKISGVGKRIYFCTPCRYYDFVRENAALSGLDIEITGAFGVLPFIKKHSDRIFLALGILLSILFLSLMSLRVWTISVSGNNKVFASEILSVCEDMGLKAGAKKSSIDVQTFQNELLERMGDRLIWVSLNIEGMSAEIEVREIKKHEYDVIEKPCNIIADFDGVIKIMRVYSGTPEISRGSGVHKGDLLISGVIDYETGESSFTEARGKITALHTKTIKTKKKEKISVRNYGETKIYYSLSLFGLEINPFVREKENYEITKEEKKLVINNVTLPFYIGVYRVTPFEENTSENKDLLSLIALSEHLLSVREEFKNSRILTHTAKKSDGFKEKFEVIDYIGEKSVILLNK